MMMMMDNSIFIQRILNILQSNKNFADKISEFRFGDIGDNKDKILNANSYPLCFVTTATNPEVSRDSIFPQGNVSLLAGQKIVLEFWIIVIVGDGEPQQTQKTLYSLTNDILDIMSNNIQLRDSDGNDRLCATSEVFTQKRLETNRGKLVEAMTIRIRPTIFVSR